MEQILDDQSSSKESNTSFTSYHLIKNTNPWMRFIAAMLMAFGIWGVASAYALFKSLTNDLTTTHGSADYFMIAVQIALSLLSFILGLCFLVHSSSLQNYLSTKDGSHLDKSFKQYLYIWPIFSILPFLLVIYLVLYIYNHVLFLRY